jgi:hypothetical protein
VNKFAVYILAVAVLGMASFSCDVLSKTEVEVAQHPEEDLSGRAETQITVDHPLWLGRLSEPAQNLRMREFEKAVAEAKEEKKSKRPIFREFIDDLGVKKIIGYFEENDPVCHGILHHFGGVIRERVNDLETSLALCQDACTYACIHGVLRTHFSQVAMGKMSLPEATAKTSGEQFSANMKKIKDDVTYLCREDSKLVKDFFRGNCAHAVGHAFGAVAKSIKKAEEYCVFFEEPGMQYYCHTGVFMELRGKIKKDLYKDKKTPGEKLEAGVDYCIHQTKWPSACMRFILKAALDLEEGKIIAPKCAALKGKDRLACFNGLGYNARVYVFVHPTDINKVCNYGEIKDREICISGIVFTKKNLRGKEKLVKACQYMKNEKFRVLCEDQNKRYYYQLDNPVMNRMITEG